MSKAARRFLCVLAIATIAGAGLPTSSKAQSIPDGSQVAKLLAAAETECKALDLEAPARLDLSPDAISWIDLDGDEARDDAIVDFNAIYCSLSGSMWHGTGGAPIHALIDAQDSGASLNDARANVWTGWGWQVVLHSSGPVLLLQRHGTACGGSGAERCIMAVTFGPKGAQVITDP